MIIQGKKVIIFDIEVFPNVYHCTCKNTETNEYRFFEISSRKIQIEELVEYFLQENVLFCGYNNHHYDDVVINYIIDYCKKLQTLPYFIITKSIYNLSSTIIHSEDDINKYKKWKYMHFFKSMDLLTMLYSSKLRVGLKEIQLTMHFNNVQEFDGDFTDVLPEERIDEMIKYNINDVDSSEELLNRCEKDIQLRLFIEKEYGIECLSMDSVKFGETILAKKYCEAVGITKKQLEQMSSPMDTIPLKDVILPFIKYQNPILQNVLEDMKKQIVSSKQRKGYENQFVLDGVKYSVGVGGIHSINKPEVFKPKDDEYIGHADVTSMYPSFIIKYNFGPKHLGKTFIDIYSDIFKERIEAKHNGEKLKNLALKLTLNSVSGKMQQETSWMYDPFNVFCIRINGQLVLLMLVDKLLSLNCKIIQVNTDGVMFVSKRINRELIQNAIKEIEQLTQLEFESDDYEAFYQFAVNDYFGLVEGFSRSNNQQELIEKKGMFITKTNLGKGLAPVIIPKAVINYFTTGEDPGVFIRNCKDIKDFLMGQRVDKKFKVVHGEKPVQRINRFYASENGCYLFKVDETGPKKKYINLLTKSGVTILNKFDNIPIDERRINYRYYISEARKIIAEFETRQLDLFSVC